MWEIVSNFVAFLETDTVRTFETWLARRTYLSSFDLRFYLSFELVDVGEPWKVRVEWNRDAKWTLLLNLDNWFNMSIHVTPLRKAVSTNVSLTPNATNPIRLDTCEIKKWKKAMTAKYDESVQEQEKSYQIHSNVSSDAVTEVLFAPDSTPAKTPDTRIPISLETCTPVLGTASTSTPATSTGYLISNWHK